MIRFIILALLIVLDVRISMVETQHGECEALHVANTTYTYLCNRGE
jgi:hypothetical protein